MRAAQSVCRSGFTDLFGIGTLNEPKVQPGEHLDYLEEKHIRLQGGLQKEGGDLANKRHELRQERYDGAQQKFGSDSAANNNSSGTGSRLNRGCSASDGCHSGGGLDIWN